MLIREAKPEEQNQVIALYEQEPPEQFQLQQKEIPPKFIEFQEHKRLILVAEESSKIIGSIQLKFFHTNPELADGKTIAHTESLIVEPTYRNKGIGKALMKEMEQRALSLGFSKITAGIKRGPSHQFLLDLYTKLSYSILREKEDGTATILYKEL